MPYGDKTGPNGQGPRSGRGFRNCNGQQDGAGAERGAGRGQGRSAGRGMGGGKGRGQDRGCAPGVAGQGNSWFQIQLNSLQAAVEKLSAQMGKDK